MPEVVHNRNCYKKYGEQFVPVRHTRRMKMNTEPRGTKND